jgi:Flavodoxin reductases (ferredoxin-NADPH reductases) family 1
MGEKHLVRFEPVGIEIEVDENQTILRAAAEQGVQLMHGCKEGQCAACKSFVLEGEDIELDSYSTFALPDYEKEEGSTLLCRAHAYEDLVIELLNYDEEIIRSGLPLRKGVAEVVSNEPVTHDMRHLVLKLLEPEEIKFFPGQYLDITVPGTDESRSFSMANTPGRVGHFEFVIKVYPDGLFSEFLADRVQIGDRLDVEGRSAPSHCGRAIRRTWCSSPVVPVSPLRLACSGRWPNAAWTARRSSTTAAASNEICASRRNCGGWSNASPASGTSRRSPSPPVTTTGTARSV